MTQSFYFFRFEFKRPVKLISPLVPHESSRGYGNSNAGWAGGGGREGDAYFKLKDEILPCENSFRARNLPGHEQGSAA